MDSILRADDPEALKILERFRRAHELPTRGFVSADRYEEGREVREADDGSADGSEESEPQKANPGRKPQYIDLRSPLFLRRFRTILCSVKKRAAIVEAYPRLGCSLAGEADRSHTVELLIELGAH